MWRIIFLILFITLSATHVYANPDPLDLSDTVRLTLPKYNAYPRPSVIDQLDPHWRYRIPGVVKIEYVGLHDIFFSQIRRRVIAQGRTNLRRRWDTGMINDREFNRGMDELSGTMEPQWYNRPWFYSLPPEKGGAPKEQYVHEIGWSIDPAAIPIISWFYHQFRKLGDIWIEHDHYYDGQEDGPDPLRPDRSRTKADNANNSFERLKVTNALPDVVVQRGGASWYSGASYHLRFKPSVRLRPSQGTDRIIDEVSMKILFQLYWNNGGQRRHFADLVFFGSHDIPNNNTTVTVSFQLVTW